jgi:hypothetical protein
MAGGGFQVCGNITLDAPHVMIYNTNDPDPTGGATTYGKVGQVTLNTTGTVTLGPQTRVKDALYAGFTIFQDRGQVVDRAILSPTSYGAVQTLASTIDASTPTFNVTGNTSFTCNTSHGPVVSTICPGNAISIGTAPNDERMIVTDVKANGANSTTIAVNRGYDATVATTHAAGSAVNSVSWGGDSCDSKAGSAVNGDHSDMDISFVAAGSAPGGEPLDNVSGTIYAAGPRADFENALFGSANLAVLVSCIFIDSGDVPGATSDFSFIPDNNNLAGVGVSLAE